MIPPATNPKSPPPGRQARVKLPPPATKLHVAAPQAAESGGILMRRMLWLGGFGAALLLTTSANADWNDFWHRVGVDFHRNNAWPEPFLSADREVTREYFRIQVNNGWR